MLEAPPLDAVTDLEAAAVYVPVRHHSPACARVVETVIRQVRPGAVLIEGPSDYNDQLDQLALDHELPVAIYSYVRLPDGSRRGAYYPFCDYSPEWVALAAAREVGAEAAFIDLPWADVAAADAAAHRYGDGELRRSAYVSTLLKRLGHETFDALWDELFEVEPDPDPMELLKRCHAFCLHARILDRATREVDRRREAFMAARIREAIERHEQVVVVTGGFHSYALHARVSGTPFPEPLEPTEFEASIPVEEEQRGIALTPYSFARLDALQGYEAGMPGPGFYQEVWEGRRGSGFEPQRVLAEIVRSMRARKQQVSAADVIAVEATARALASLRGQPGVWRRELLDAVAAALIKDPLDPVRGHPLLYATHAVLRGDARGLLDRRATVPPLVHEVQRLLRALDLEAPKRGKTVRLELSGRDAAAALERSRVLHRLRLLDVAGFRRVAGTDLAERDDLGTVWEEWQLRWSPDQDSALVEASIYGSSLVEATCARLAETGAALERDAAGAARLLLDASLAGLTAEADGLRARTAELLRQDGQLTSVAGALGDLLYLYCYDAVLQTQGTVGLGELVASATERGLWLLEAMQGGDDDGAAARAVSAVLQAHERCPELKLPREELVGVLARCAANPAAAPGVRGACLGALWVLGEVPGEEVRRALRGFGSPEVLGEFLGGLFALAREAVQQDRALLAAIDGVLTGYDAEAFLEVLPSLRLAFSRFTPREKHTLALTLVEEQGTEEGALPALQVDAATVERSLAFEARLLGLAHRYGLRGAE